jgi:HprK-related kinase B
MSNKKLQDLKTQLLQEHTLEEQSLLLQCGDCIIQLQSNSVQLLEELQHYFRYLLIEHTTAEADIRVIAIESAVLEMPYVFQDWPREAGKSGRKDAYYDLEDARLVRKVRTGMLFLQSETCRIAVGPCLAYPNQVINFINSQHMNWLQQRHWLICHAAAVVYQNQTYAMAGFSGGGKSTFMLHLMNDDEINFLSNDRLFIRRNENTVDVVGIAKLPRINPGTIVNNPRLQSLIPEQERQQLLSLPKQQLWDIEDKYDVDIESVYGCGRISDNKPLRAFIVLNWQHGSEQAFQVNKINLHKRRDLLATVMKSSGPFYQDKKGAFLMGNTGFDEERYLSILSGIVIYEVCGKIDFEALHDYFYQNILCEAI